MLRTWRHALLLGVLVGLVEGGAIVRYDWIMDDPQPWRLGAGLLWAGLILAMNGLIFVGLNRLCRRSLTALSLVWLVPICGVRAWSGDRFEWWSLIPAVLALALSRGLDRRPRLLGLFAVCLALPGLWGKVPVYGSAWAEWL
jgi:hypothetical protein